MWDCVVCRKPITIDQEPHTYHEAVCPQRHSQEQDCEQIGECGHDCHEGCCPTCNGD